MINKKILITIIFSLVFVLNIMSVLAIEESIDVGDYTINYEYNVNDAEAGERFNLKITITNNDGTNKTNIDLDFDETNPFEFVNDDDFRIDLLEPDESKSKTLKIKIDDDAKSQEHELEFSLKDDYDDYDYEIDIEVDSSQPELIIGDIKSVPTIIGADLEDIELKVNIENIGGGDAFFVRARIILPQGFTSSSSYSDISNLGIIEEGEGKEVSFFIDSEENIDSEVYNAIIELEYEDPKDNPRKDQLNLDIPIKGKPQFNIVSFKTEPRNPIQGSEGKLEILIENIGEEKGMETSVRVFENADLPIEFDEKTNFIGNLKKGETGTASFKFNVDDNANLKTHLIKVQIRTIDKNNILVSEKSISIKIDKKEERSLVFYILVLVPILIIILIVLMFRLRTKNPISKKETLYM